MCNATTTLNFASATHAIHMPHAACHKPQATERKRQSQQECTWSARAKIQIYRRTYSYTKLQIDICILCFTCADLFAVVCMFARKYATVWNECLAQLGQTNVWQLIKILALLTCSWLLLCVFNFIYIYLIFFFGYCFCFCFSSPYHSPMHSLSPVQLLPFLFSLLLFATSFYFCSSFCFVMLQQTAG